MKNTHKKYFTITNEFKSIYNNILEDNINTICVEAKCPNINECFLSKRMTFLILGDICTRNCSYCSVKYDKIGSKLEYKSIDKIINFSKKNALKHIILTSVARDDISDGGSEYYANSIKKIKDAIPSVIVESLVPDFGYKKSSIKKIKHSSVDIISHNIELTKSVFSKYRTVATYQKSLELLQIYADSDKKIKSGFIIGLGESMQDIYKTIDDVYQSGVKLLSIGQYLSPTPNSVRVKKLYTLDEFDSINKYVDKYYDFEKTSIDIFSRSSYMDFK